MNDWGGRGSMIGLVSMEESLDVIYYVISIIQNIFIRCRNGDKVIGRSVLNILLDFLHLEVHQLRVKREKIRGVGDFLMGIVEYIVKHCVLVDIHGLKSRWLS